MTVCRICSELGELAHGADGELPALLHDAPAGQCQVARGQRLPDVVHGEAVGLQARLVHLDADFPLQAAHRC